MSRYTPTTVTSGYNTTDKINQNFADIQAAIDDTLSRVGDSPNQLETDVDFNSNRIYNLPSPNSPTEPLRLADISLLSFADASVPAVSSSTAGKVLSNDGTNLSWDTVSKVISSVSALKAVSVTSVLDKAVYMTRGYSTEGVGSAFYRYNSASSATADDVTIIQPNSGSGRWELIYDDSIFVEWAGAIGDGSTNDASALTSAFNAAVTISAAGNPLNIKFKHKKYKCNSVIGSFFASNLTVDFNNATLDFSGVSTAETSAMLEFLGTYGSSATLTSNAAADQKIIAVASAGFAVGDMVRVYSEKIWDATRTSTKIGELNFIETIPGGTSVTTTMELQTAYGTIDTAKIQKLTPVQGLTVKSGRFIGPTGNNEARGLRIRVGQKCLVENMRFDAFDYLSLQLTDCTDCTVTACSFENAGHNTTAYGVSFADTCQDCKATSNTFRNVRHSMSTNNNTSSSYGIVRRVLFEGNIISDSAPTLGGTGGDAIDTHAAAEDISIINNIINSSSGVGINVEARSAIIRGNRIMHTNSLGIFVNSYSDDYVGAVIIDGNFISEVGDGVGSDYGIQVQTRVQPYNNITISNNVISNTNNEPIRVIGQSSVLARNVVVSGNSISTTANQGIYLSYVDGGSVCGNSVTAVVTPLRYEDCKRLTISGNKVSSTTSASTVTGIRGVSAGGAGSSAYNVIIGNVVDHQGSPATRRGIDIDAEATGNSQNTAIYNNTLYNCTTTINTGTGTGNKVSYAGSTTYDPPSLADGAGTTTTVTVTGAALGDIAIASFSLDLQGIALTAWVSAANTVSVRFQNESGGVLDLASGTLTAKTERV